MPRRKTPHLSSLTAFIHWVEELMDEWTTEEGLLQIPLFRGVGDASFGLVPGIYRRAETRDLYVDWKLRAEFVRQAGPLVTGHAPQDIWDWYCLMQHYGMPTRLLDWTEGALVALYFALKSCIAGRKPAVWALNPWFLNAATVGHMYILKIEDLRRLAEFKAYLNYEDAQGDLVPKLPIVFAPTIIDTRMLGQRSYFTLHGSDMRGLDGIPELRHLVDQGYLRKVVFDLSDDEMRRVRMLLSTCGITEVTVFPDVGGLIRQVISDFSGL